MFKNHFTIAWRNLLKHRSSSLINILGLASGMAVAILIGIWVFDELSFDKYHPNYDRIAKVIENQALQNGVQTFDPMPAPLATELRSKFSNDFERVAAATMNDQPLVVGQKKVTRFGAFAEKDFPAMLSLKIIAGNGALKDPSSILLSKSLSLALFGAEEAVNKTINVAGNLTLQVAAVYEDLPQNTSFKDLAFIAPLELLFHDRGFKSDDWNTSAFQIYTQVKPGVDFAVLSNRIKDLMEKNNKDASKSALFLFPMSRWHLYGEFRNGVSEPVRIQFVWLFSITGICVLLLACINFMNLATATTEKRAKEVGIRKAIGSLRKNLLAQFFIESFLIVAISFVAAMALTVLLLPYFNEVAGKQIALPLNNYIFWIICSGFCMVTGFLAGSYPAFYLSSFKPVKVLKGPFKAGRHAATPRKILVVTQFTLSITLIIGTIVVFNQVEFARNRPAGYNRSALITVPLSPQLQVHYEALQDELKKTGSVINMVQSSSPTTGVWSSANNLNWTGKDPSLQASFGTISSSSEYGKTVGWKIKEGRDFSAQLATDSLAFVFNEAAIQLMGLSNPVGARVRWHGKDFTVIGVVKNMLMGSPFDPAQPTVFMMNRERGMNLINIRLNPGIGTAAALAGIKPIIEKYEPENPFQYKFADEEFALKFASEARVGKLAAFFAVLAIVISCMGLFGMASFIAEQRTKEIGIRKVLGASVISLWGLLSKEFALLVALAFIIAAPAAWWLMSKWLNNYEYHAHFNAWIFGGTGAGIMLITLLTVSLQAIRAAIANPVKSLKTE